MKDHKRSTSMVKGARPWWIVSMPQYNGCINSHSITNTTYAFHDIDVLNLHRASELGRGEKFCCHGNNQWLHSLYIPMSFQALHILFQLCIWPKNRSRLLTVRDIYLYLAFVSFQFNLNIKWSGKDDAVQWLCADSWTHVQVCVCVKLSCLKVSGQTW